ncbi:hypothetical protein RRG08_056945 [Elysia crispata]|uniref:Uncharacterized protein n=1 Tax=Elysia crispata TaxID=231223 RepID=A0AAE0Y6V9_9GAST|nr:hypothetical protein RRG08_056945 [Elysia crispata]
MTPPARPPNTKTGTTSTTTTLSLIILLRTPLDSPAETVTKNTWVAAGGKPVGSKVPLPRASQSDTPTSGWSRYYDFLGTLQTEALYSSVNNYEYVASVDKFRASPIQPSPALPHAKVICLVC